MEIEHSAAVSSTLDVWQARVSTHFDVMLLAISDRLHHYERVSSVKAACHVCVIDQGQKLEIRPANIITILYFYYFLTLLTKEDSYSLP